MESVSAVHEQLNYLTSEHAETEKLYVELADLSENKVNDTIESMRSDITAKVRFVQEELSKGLDELERSEQVIEAKTEQP